MTQQRRIFPGKIWIRHRKHLYLHMHCSIQCIKITTQRCYGNVIFSLVSVCLSVHTEGVSHVTIIHDALDLTVQGPPECCLVI